MKQRHDHLEQEDPLDFYLRRDLKGARRACPEAVLGRVLDSIEPKPPLPVHQHRTNWRGLALAAAALMLLTLGTLWFDRSAEIIEPVESPSVASTITPPQSSEWIAPRDLLAGLERGAKLEQERLVRDLDRVQAAVLGELAVTLQVGNVFTSRPR